MAKEALRDWLLELHASYGKLTPAIVKEAARPEDSPAHYYVFNLPPNQAAEAWYEERARRLIQIVKVKVESSSGELRFVRVFHALPGEEGYEFQPVSVLVQQPEKLALVRQEAQRRLGEAEGALEDLDCIIPDRKRTSKALAKVREARELIETAAD